MLYQPFVLSGDLSVRLSLELLNKVRNPESIYGPASVTSGSGNGNQVSANQRSGVSGASGQPSSYSADPDGDDDVIVRPPPARIESRSSRTSQKTKSELNSKYRKFADKNFVGAIRRKFCVIRVAYLIFLNFCIPLTSGKHEF